MFFQIKALLFWLLLASPAVAAWMFREPSAEVSQVAAPEPLARVPVEIITKGSAPRWVYVEVGSQAVPEPGMVSLLALTSVLLAFRRQRTS